MLWRAGMGKLCLRLCLLKVDSNIKQTNEFWTLKIFLFTKLGDWFMMITMQVLNNIENDNKSCVFGFELEPAWRPPTPRKMRGGIYFFCYRGAFWRTLVYIWGESCFLDIGGGGRIIRGLVVSIILKENLPVVNINYLHMAYNFKDKLRHLL